MSRRIHRSDKNEPFGSSGREPFEEGPEVIETQVRALSLIDALLRRTDPEDPNFELLLLLRHQCMVDERQFREAQQAIAEFEEVYRKLTSPANRIGTYLGSSEEGIAHVALGDGEYFSNVDPNMDIAGLAVGTRVKLNDAYVVVGDLGYATGGPMVKAGEVLEDGRLRITGDPPGTNERIVLLSTALAEGPIKPGDEVRLDPTLRVAIERFSRAETRDYYYEEVPEIPWSKIGGQEDAIALIRDTIELPLLHPELYARFDKKPLKGILLYGPPGCGKTLIGKATAYNLTREYRRVTQRDVREYFMYINGPRILNMWLGESERMVREIFTTARERAKEGYLVFVFMDEADAILRTRSSGRYLNIANTVVPQFSAEMDGLVSLENVVVMLTSNRPDYIDPAVLRPERIDRKVKVGRPDRRAARDILAIYLHAGVPLDPEVLREHGGDAAAAREVLLDETVELIFRRNGDTKFLEVNLINGRVESLYWKDLLSGALLMSVVDRAKDFAIKRAIEEKSDNEGVGRADLERAVRLEFKENEIFPKTDTQEDWLKLLDYEPDEVVNIKPIRQDKRAEARLKKVI